MLTFNVNLTSFIKSIHLVENGGFMGWMLDTYEKMTTIVRLKKEFQKESTQRLLEAHLKAMQEKRLLPKSYYSHFFITYLEMFTLIGHGEPKLIKVFNHSRDVLIKVYGVKEHNLNLAEAKMTKKWGLTIGDGK